MKTSITKGAFIPWPGIIALFVFSDRFEKAVIITMMKMINAIK